MNDFEFERSNGSIARVSYDDAYEHALKYAGREPTKAEIADSAECLSGDQ